jgi:glycosyltransferase involved in cell wall biosynthesis
MNILHVLRSLNPSQGGPPVVAACLASAQAALGHRVALAYTRPAGDRPGDQAEDQAKLLQASVPGMERVELLPVPLARSLPLGLPALAGAMRDLAAGRDMLHLHGVWDPVLPLAARAAKASGVPYALTPHGMLDPWCLAQKRLKKRLALRLFYADMLRGARFLHVLSGVERDHVQALGLGQRLSPSLVVLPNGLFRQELSAMVPGGPHSRGPGAALGRAGRPYALFLGRLHFKKGLDILAEAFRLAAQAVPQADLVVAGPDEGAGQAFRRAVEGFGLGDRVRLTGPLYGADKLDALRGAACFCLPSRQEGFSMAALEALGCGTPVVLSRQCNFPEAEAAGAGLCVDLTPQAVADALAAYLTGALENPALGRSTGQAGRALVAARYTWEAIAADMLAAYGAKDADRTKGAEHD